MAFAPAAALTVNSTTAQQQTDALERATDLIRAATGQLISRATTTDTVYGNGNRWLQLPEVPVVSVTSVAVDGITWTVDLHYTVTPDGRLLNRRGVWGRYWAVTVNYTHGYNPVPAELVRLCAKVADGILAGPRGAGIRSESQQTGPFQRTVTYDPNTTGLFSADDQRVLDKYRLPLLP